MAPIIFKTAFFLVVMVLVVSLVLDAILILRGKRSISDWLRSNPRWYVCLAGAMLGFLLVLGLHLFVVPF